MPANGVFKTRKPFIAQRKTSLQPIQEEDDNKITEVLTARHNEVDMKTKEDIGEDEETEVENDEETEVEEDEGIEEQDIDLNDQKQEVSSPKNKSGILYTISNFTWDWKVFFGAVYTLAFISYLASITLENRSYDISVFLFHRILAVLYLISFWSIKVQILGLCGKHGILPVKDTMDSLKEMKKAKFRFPTLFWFKSSDRFIMSVCWCGVLSSGFYFFNILPTLTQSIAFICFLSFKTAGREFFALQFDNLLLDTSIIGLLLPPISVIPFIEIPTTFVYNRSVLWLARWLQFRLMLGSGLCKVTSGDLVWKSGMALQYHYWSQPMPSWVSYYADKQPVLLHKFSCYYHFFVELIAPFGVFFPPLFLLIFLVQASLQVGILVTGNYGIFNLLAILLPFILLDDSVYPPFVSNVLRPYAVNTAITHNLLLVAFYAVVGLGLVVMGMSVCIVPFAQVVRGSMPVPKWIAKIQSKISPFGLMNYYGLFARMTTSRREIIIEGCNDSQGEWEEYEFKYKIGDVKKCPKYVIGHLPRLDWRMWFCQFSAFNHVYTGWFDSFLLKLLQGSPEVLALLEKDPFEGQPPKFLRCVSYEYRFASLEERKLGQWWTRTQKRLYWPPCTLHKGKMLYLLQ